MPRASASALSIVSVLVGALLFWLMVKLSGAAELWFRIRQLDERFLIILLLGGLRPLSRTFAWRLCLPNIEEGVSFLRMWQARLIGDAIGNLTTAGPLLAEPSRLLVITRELSASTAAASLSLELLSYLFSSCLMMLAGLVVLISWFAIHGSLQIVTAILLVFLFVTIGLMMLSVWNRWSLAHHIQILISKLSHYQWAARLQRPIHKLHGIENHIYDFARINTGKFLLVMLCEASFHVLGVLEIGYTLELLSVEYSWLSAFIFESINRVINSFFAFVPVKLGVDELGTGLLASAIGFPSAIGVAMAVYRKLRVLFWTLIGLILLARVTWSKPQSAV